MSNTGTNKNAKLLENKNTFTIVICTFILLSVSQANFAHGTVTSPPSRVWNCYLENPKSPDSPPCIDAVASHGTQPLYDWNAINQASANGNHMEVVPNGNLIHCRLMYLAALNPFSSCEENTK